MSRLFVVATPIGNLSDFSPRAIDTLRSVSLIAAEDTRFTMRLCAVFDIHTPLVSCHQHNEERKAETLIARMKNENIDIALTTDAGTPCISDPGYALVREAVKNGIEVIPIPGCCAAVAALSVCGFDTREFAFYGFLPRGKKELKEKLRKISAGPSVAVVHESPYRIIDLMETIANEFPDIGISLSCDLTKLHEATIRGTPKDVLCMLKENPKTEKGEYCAVLDFHGAAAELNAEKPEIEQRLSEIFDAGCDRGQALEMLLAEGYRKNAIKAAMLRAKRDEELEDESV